MMKSTKQVLLAVALVTCLFACKKKFDEFYEPPASLEPPIYAQLLSRGNFTKFLSLVDKAGYKQTLGAAGFWTVFAPTDSAFNSDTEFKAWLQDKGIASVETMDSATAQSIVQYLLVYNAFNKDRLDDYQSNLGWVVDNAFKRRTAYYTGFYNDTSFAGTPVKAISSNRNNSGAPNSYFNPNDNNNKYIPFFTSEYFGAKGLTGADYNYFYPNTGYSGFNVANARVVTQNIDAENGVIHIIDHVVTPLFSLDQYIRTKPEYSEFRNLFEKFMVLFVQNNDATNRYRVLTGSADNVFVKTYSNLMAFSLNNENHLKLQDNDGQKDGWTMFAPKNDSLLAYLDVILKEGYGNVNNLPPNAIADLLNSHLWQTTVWPSKFSSTLNFLGEPSYMNPQTNIVDKKVLSNGFFYGTNKVQEPNVFSTVYGKSYLNPKFSIMTRLLDVELRTMVTNPSIKYTVFMMSDAVLNAQGYSYNVALNSWVYNSNSNDSNRLNLLRMLNSSVVETPNGELDNLGQPGFTAAMTTYGGELLKFSGNRVISSGTQDKNLTVTIDSVKTARNGRVVYLNNLLWFTYFPVGQHLENLGNPAASEFNLFWNYLKNSTAYDVTAKSIVGMSGGSFYTVFVPKNSAIRDAIAAGLLPGTPTTPNFTPTATADKLLVEKFIQYHILDKRQVIADGKDIGSFATLLKNSSGDPLTVNVFYPANVFELSDNNNRKAKMVDGFANNLSNRTAIHLIDNYLKY